MICSQSRYFKFSLTHGISLNKFYKSGESSVESPVLSLSPQHARSAWPTGAGFSALLFLPFR